MLKILTAWIVFCFVTCAYADSLYLKNGRNIEGLIKSEDGKTVELEVCQGEIKFLKSEILKIQKSSSEEAGLIRRRCEEQKVEAEAKLLKNQKEEEGRPKTVAFSADSNTISVIAKINNKIDVTLVLDTGATMILLRREIAEELGINLEEAKPDSRLTLADGRNVNAKRIVLESVKVEGVEAQNVPAAVILDKVGKFSFGDGLLGMSFLNRFNFKVDHRERKLILEKLYQ